MVRGDSRSSNAFAHTEIEIMRSAQLVRHGAEDHQGRTHTIVPSYQGSQCWDAGLSDRLAPNYLKHIHDRPDQRKKSLSSTASSSSANTSAMLIASTTLGRRAPKSGAWKHGSGALGLEQSRAFFAATSRRFNDAHNPYAVRSYQGPAPLPNAHCTEGLSPPPVRRDQDGKALRNQLTMSRELQDFERRCQAARKLAEESFGRGPMECFELGESQNEPRKACLGVSVGTQTDKGKPKSLMMVHSQIKQTDSWLYADADSRSAWRA